MQASLAAYKIPPLDSHYADDVFPCSTRLTSSEWSELSRDVNWFYKLITAQFVLKRARI